MDPFYGKELEKPGKIFADISANRRKERRVEILCYADKKSGCQCPEELKGKPEEWTPEQVEKCHGSKDEHPCAPKERREE